MKVYIATLLVSLVYGNKLERRIVDGYRTPAKPWMVRLDHPYNVCGGTLYINCAIITAAHCSDKYTEDWEALLNRYNLNLTSKQEGGSTHPVLEIANHPSYDKDTNAWDVAVWRIDNTSVDQTIVDLDDGTEARNKNLFVYVLGWGRTQRVTQEEFRSKNNSGKASQYLMEAKLPLVDEKKCIAKHQYFMNPDINICTGYDYDGPSVCAGDSGGPIYRKRNGRIILMGIPSMMWGCGHSDFYNVHTKVSNIYITNFINNRAREFVKKNKNNNNRNPTISVPSPNQSQTKGKLQLISSTQSPGLGPNTTPTRYIQPDYQARIRQSQREFLENISRNYQIDIPDFF